MIQALGLLLLLLAATSPADAIRDGAVGPDSSWELNVESGGSLRLADLLKASAPILSSGLELSRRRAKRSVFLQPGVRICSQESIEEVLASHLSYYQLRVCQEAVWEAFRIFLDRIPGTSEYQTWVHACQQEALCVSDIARNFSRSQEHVGLIQRRMRRLKDKRPPTRSATGDAVQQRPEVTGTEAPATSSPSSPQTSAAPPSPAEDPTRPARPSLEDTKQDMDVDTERDTDLPNAVPDRPQVHVVEFSINLPDPGYRELLGHPDSPQYVDLAQHLQDQMQPVFGQLPGFKGISVLGIRETLDSGRVEGISVHYSLILENNIHPATSEATSEAEASADFGLRQMVMKALQEKALLPVSLDSLHFQPGEVIALPTSSLSSSSTSSPGAEAESEPREPDSHNEFKVFIPVPEMDKAPPPAPVAPKDTENDLVTLLDSTAVSHGETITVTDGMTVIADPASEDIIDESKAIYATEPEPSAQEQEEEELLIITHEIETIHQEEIGELVRVYIPTPPLTTVPFITPSPNLISEEDLTPAEEGGESPRFTPTVQILFTATASHEMLSESIKPEIVSGRSSTERGPVLQEEDDLNSLPEEEKLDLGVFKPDQGDVLDKETYDIKHVQTESELTEPEEAVVVQLDEGPEGSRTGLEEVGVSRPEDVVVMVSEPEQKEDNREEVPEVTLLVPQPEKELVEVPEKEEEMELIGSLETMSYEDVKERLPEVLEENVPDVEKVVIQDRDGEVTKETFPEGTDKINDPEVTEKRVPVITAESVPDITAQSVPDVTEESVPDVTEGRVPDVTAESVPDVTAESVPDITEESVPDITEEKVPDVTEESVPDVTKQSVPSATEESVPDITEESVPDVTEESVPDVTKKSVPDITEQSVTVTEVIVPEVKESVPEVTEEKVPDIKESVPGITKQSLPNATEESVPDVTEESVPDVTEESVPDIKESVLGITKESVPDITKQSVPDVTEVIAPEVKESVPEVTEENVPCPTEQSVPDITKESVPGITKESVPNATEQSFPDITEVNAPDVTEESVPDVPEESVPDVTEERVPDVTEERAPDVTEESVTDVTEESVTDVKEESVTDVKEESVTDITGESVPDVTEESVPNVTEESVPDITEESFPNVTEESVPDVTEESVPDDTKESVLEVTEESVPEGPEKAVSRVSEESVGVGQVTEEVSESEEPVPKVSGADRVLPGKKSVTLVEFHVEVPGADSEDVKPKPGKVAVLLPDRSPVNITEPEGSPQSEEKTEAPAEASSPGPGTEPKADQNKSGISPAIKDPLEGSEPQSKEEVIEPEPKRDAPEPAVESIKIIHSLDTVEELHYREEDTLAGSKDHEPSVEDNLPILPGLTQDLEEEAPDLVYPIIEHVDRTDTEVNKDTGAPRTTEPLETDASPEDSASAEPAAETKIPSGDSGVSDESPNKRPEGMVVTASPVSEAFPSPPPAVDLLDSNPPYPTADSGPFEFTKEDGKEVEPSEPSVVMTQPKSLAFSPAGEEFSGELDQLSTAGITAPPPLRYLTTPTMTTSSHSQELVVFFSLRLTNMDFSEDLFNKTSSEYRSLENTLVDVLLPYLQANLTGFRRLEILNFRKGSVVVNSRLQFARSVPYNITEAVRCSLEEFCSAAARKLHMHIDRRSLDVEPADRADPCRYLACGGASRCVVDGQTAAARCVCEPGFVSVDGEPCRSVCDLQPDRCPDGECQVVPGRRAECRSKGRPKQSGLSS